MRYIKKFKFSVLLIVILIFSMTGCDNFEIIKPENEDKPEVTSEESGGSEEVTVAPEPTTTQVEKTEAVVVTEAEVESIDPEEDLVEDLFITQFEQDKPYELEVELSELSDEGVGWSFDRKENHEPVTSYSKLDLDLFDAYFIKPTDEKVVYLTFDEGYENGYTEEILDVLMEYGVKATFFITGHYINTQPDLVNRMVEEGHIVGNHSVNHPKFSTLTADEIYDEITVLADDFEDLTGTEIAPFFRPPSGDHSEKSLYLTRKLGYRTIFWSMAYADWDPEKQPGEEAAYEHVMTNYHPGAIILLHAVSESNTLALPDILRDLLAEGYRFGSLYEFGELE